MTAAFSRSCVRHEAAAAMVRAALAYAEANGWRIAVAICEPTGALVAFGRADGVSPAVCDYARDKAWTAAVHGRTTQAFGERMASDPLLALGLSTRRRALAWEGGLPILEDGVLIGGVGVSGATGPEDADCAAAALRAVLGPGRS
jgi:glc operon protein GlcG